MTDNLLYTSAFKVAGTVSWRTSSSKFMGLYGGNQQNVADSARRLFVPSPGYIFNQNDYEGAEAVAVALLCREGNFRECVRLKVKIHNFVCVKIFPDLFAEFITPDQIAELTPTTFRALECYKKIIALCKKLKVEYDLAKRTVHGANYSMGWRTFQRTVLRETSGRVVLTAAQCKQLLAAYFELFPEVREYQAFVEENIKEMRAIANLFGHEATFIRRFTMELARTGISWSPQSTVGVLAVMAATRHQDYITKHRKRWHIHNIVHDSILQSCPIEEADEASRALADNMRVELTSPLDGWRFTIGVERQIGMNWGKYDETDNPNGVKALTE